MECGEIHSGSREFHRGHQHERPNGAARIDWPSRTGTNDHRAGHPRPRTPTHSRRENKPLGHYAAVGGNSRRKNSARAGRRHVALSAGRARAAGANHSGQAETEISNSFVQAAAAYAENPVALHLRAMNMLYEAIKEKGSMVIVPSSAVETMGLGGTLATASLGGAKAQ